MDLKTFVILVTAVVCFHLPPTTFQADTEFFRVTVGDPVDRDLITNETFITSPAEPWNQPPSERVYAMDRMDKDVPEEEELDEEDDDDMSAKSRISKRQVIKIPKGVTKVKVIAPESRHQMRLKRMPPSLRSMYSSHHMRKRPPRRYPHKRPPPPPEPENEYDEYEEPKHHRTRESEGKRSKGHSKKPKVIVKEVTAEEFFNESDDAQHLSSTKVDAYQNPGKHSARKPSHHPSRKPQRHVHYSSSDDMDDQPPPQRFSRKPASEKDAGYDAQEQYNTNKKEYEYSRPVRQPQQPQQHYDTRSPTYSHPEYTSNTYEYEERAASNIHMKQVPAPNLTGLNLIDPPDMMKEARPTTFRTAKESAVVMDYTAKKSPSTRDMQSSFPNQYTSHNPHVVTNFGLDETKTKTKSYTTNFDFPNLDQRSYESFGSGTGKYTQQATAASEQHVTTVPASGTNFSPGLQVVQPPQLGMIQGSASTIVASSPETPRGNQKATIRDILQQDCPDYEQLGYCSSPPRYPTIQIANMVTKCSELLDIMTAPIPPEPQDDLTSFSSRSDNDMDIVFDDEANNTSSSPDFPEQSWPNWSRSGSDSETACSSQYIIIEPGYAREVTTGRWFVIVQNSDSSLQKVTVDTCLNPGKPCGGLVGMKCSRNRGFHNGIKSTRCIQRYTHQRLISWDPEAPNKCPRIRVFKFPTACVCHLRLM